MEPIAPNDLLSMADNYPMSSRQIAYAEWLADEMRVGFEELDRPKLRRAQSLAQMF